MNSHFFYFVSQQSANHANKLLGCLNILIWTSKATSKMYDIGHFPLYLNVQITNGNNFKL